MTWLLSVDPGVRGCGCALWRDGLLVAAAQVFALSADDCGSSLQALAESVKCWCTVHYPDEVVVELPQTYGGRSARGDANDLIAVAAVSGAIAGAFAPVPVELVLPTEWKGSVPKEVTRRRCLEALSSAEQSRIRMPTAASLQHNVFDGLAIGLWWLKKQGVRK